MICPECGRFARRIVVEDYYRRVDCACGWFSWAPKQPTVMEILDHGFIQKILDLGKVLA